MNKLRHKLLSAEYYYFRTVFTVVDILTSSFYLILIYRVTGNTIYVLLDSLVFVTIQWVGYLIGSVFTGSLGYVKTFKLSMLLIGLTNLVIALYLQQFQFLFIAFTIFRSFPRGIFWAASNLYIVRELNQKDRNLQLSNNLNIHLIVAIILPVLLGSLLSSKDDYLLIFLISCFIAFAGSFVPWGYNKKNLERFSLQELMKVIQNRRSPRFALILSIKDGLESTSAILFLIIPFLFFKEEFAVGLLTSFVNLTAAIIIYVKRNSDIKHSVNLGYFGLFISLFGNLLLSVFWITPFLLARGLITTISSAISSPVQQKIDFEIREKILDDKVKQYSVEMNIFAETLYTIGRIFFLSILLFLNAQLQSHDLVFRIFICLSSIWGFVFINQGVKLIDKRRSIDSQLNDAQVK